MQRHIGLCELPGQAAIESKSSLPPTLLGRTADQKVRRPTKRMQESPQLGTQSYRDKKSVTFSFYFVRRKRLLKIFHHRFLSESSQLIYINEPAPVKEPARKRRKLSAPKISSKDKSSISQGRGDLNAFCLKGRYKKQKEYYSHLTISVAVINK